MVIERDNFDTKCCDSSGHVSNRRVGTGESNRKGRNRDASHFYSSPINDSEGAPRRSNRLFLKSRRGSLSS